MDWENIIAYCEESKQSKTLAGKCYLLQTINIVGVGLGVCSPATGKFCNLYRHLSLKTVFPALKLTQNCCFDYNIFFLKAGNLIINWLPFSYARVTLKNSLCYLIKYECKETFDSVFRLFSELENTGSAA